MCTPKWRSPCVGLSTTHHRNAARFRGTASSPLARMLARPPRLQSQRLQRHPQLLGNARHTLRPPRINSPTLLRSPRRTLELLPNTCALRLPIIVLHRKRAWSPQRRTPSLPKPTGATGRAMGNCTTPPIIRAETIVAGVRPHFQTAEMDGPSLAQRQTLSSPTTPHAKMRVHGATCFSVPTEDTKCGAHRAHIARWHMLQMSPFRYQSRAGG